MGNISMNTKRLYNELLDTFGQISNIKVDGVERKTEDIFSKDIVEYLLCLSITDGRIERDEINFMWELLPMTMNSLFGKYSEKTAENFVRMYAFQNNCISYCNESDCKSLKLAIALDEELIKRGKSKEKEYKTVKLFENFIQSLGQDFLSLSEFLDTTTKYTKICSYINRRYNELVNGKAAAFPAETAPEKKEEKPAEPEKTLDELMAELDELIGLETVKEEVKSMINLIKIRKMREERGLKVGAMSLHMVFYGNPGTGKTTIARLLAQIYKQLGVLSDGKLVEVDRSGLVAGYVGQTAIKTQKVIDEAMGGVLFIDEAYALTNKGSENDFGSEAIETLLKAMEDNRKDLIVIVAGYTDLMEDFIQANPGLKSRFNKYIDFPDYNPDELLGIFKMQCKKNAYIPNEECLEKAMEFFRNRYDNRDENYANARDVRNYMEKAIAKQANRLAELEGEISDEDLQSLTPEDLEGIII